jgi:hypothetical protein
VKATSPLIYRKLSNALGIRCFQRLINYDIIFAYDYLFNHIVLVSFFILSSKTISETIDIKNYMYMLRT